MIVRILRKHTGDIFLAMREDGTVVKLAVCGDIECPPYGPQGMDELASEFVYAAYTEGPVFLEQFVTRKNYIFVFRARALKN